MLEFYEPNHAYDVAKILVDEGYEVTPLRDAEIIYLTFKQADIGENQCFTHDVAEEESVM